MGLVLAYAFGYVTLRLGLPPLVGYLLAGHAEPGLPPGTLGFVYLPALFAIALASVLTAPLGARIAHTLDRRPMQRIFAVLLFLLAAYMAYKGYKGYKAY